MSELGWDELGFLEYVKPKIGNNPVLFDVGYNQGDFTQAFMERFELGHCVGFEPVYDLWCHSINGLFLEVNNLGLSDHTHTALIHYIPNSSGMSSLYNREVFDEPARGFIRQTRRVLLVTLDVWLEIVGYGGSIDYLKIDTEGHEFAVLKGAANALKEHRIRFIQFECGGCWYESQTKLSDVARYLDAFGYRLRGPDLQVIENIDNLVTPWERGDKLTVFNMLAEIRE